MRKTCLCCRFLPQRQGAEEGRGLLCQAAAAGNDGKLYLKQGRLLALDQQFKEAIPVFKQALDAGLQNPGEAQFELALAYLNLKDYKSLTAVPNWPPRIPRLHVAPPATCHT